VFIVNLFERLLRGSALLIIKAYQITISPILGPTCRFHPTCSNYAIEALKTKPLFEAFYIISTRVLRCNPLFDGGEDPVK
tara:strand:+ start:345 stop:584 length:240 start_codon:yes stop_codon:yes gene_type:complete